jgi:hypothetical protein
MSEEQTRGGGNINRTTVKRKLIQQAVDTRYYWSDVVGKDNIRVSASTLDEAEAAIDNWIRNKVEKLQSKGKTI